MSTTVTIYASASNILTIIIHKMVIGKTTILALYTFVEPTQRIRHRTLAFLKIAKIYFRSFFNESLLQTLNDLIFVIISPVFTEKISKMHRMAAHFIIRALLAYAANDEMTITTAAHFTTNGC